MLTFLKNTWKGGENRMKQMSDKALAKEAAFWGNVKKMLVQIPGKVCHK